MIRLLLSAIFVICPSDPIAPRSGGTGFDPGPLDYQNLIYTGII